MADFEAERKVEARQIRGRLAEIRATVLSGRRPIGPIEACVTGGGRGPERPPEHGWRPFDRGRVWGGFDQTTWFRMRAVIPDGFAGQTVAALIDPSGNHRVPDAEALSTASESLVYINGEPRHGLDKHRDLVFLTDRAEAGAVYDIALESVPSTRFDIEHTFHHADLAVWHETPWVFYWDALTALEVAAQHEEGGRLRSRLLETVREAVWQVDLRARDTDPAAYHKSLGRASARLRKALADFPSEPHQGSLVLAGHAHIDTAWLWPIRETRRKCGRSFANVLALMDRYPDFHFSCSQPVQYAWVKEHFPELFERIRQRVGEGRWELCGAPWIEPDHNVPSGEALVRQYLYGNRWFEREFGRRSRIAWVPDSFGYTWSLPQIMRQAGIEAFITTKISWSQFTTFPYNYFDWEGIDGTRIRAIMPPLNYNGNPGPATAREQWRRFEQRDAVGEVPFAIGYGDGGGGPTMAMIERGRRMADIAGVPRCRFGAITDSLDRMAAQARGKRLPRWNGELYLELHRACQTTQARIKRFNRKGELMLREAELLNALAAREGAGYPADDLYAAWQVLLTNQFHDILPGSSITEVYETAEREYAGMLERATHLRDCGANALIAGIDTRGEGTAVVVFNSLSWLRDGLVAVGGVDVPRAAAVVDARGRRAPVQQAPDGSLLFRAEAVPPMGHAVYHLVEERSEDAPNPLKAAPNRLENERLRVRIDKHGRITSLFDKEARRECLPKGGRGNVLQFFDDRPHLHDAWDIDHNFEAIQWEAGRAESIEVIEQGPLRARVRVLWASATYTIRQDITLAAGSRRVDFDTRVDWHEKRTLLKVAFPVDIRAQKATYEIQYGAIERPTHRNAPHDRGQFEVPAQRWADLSEGDYGVSLLNDCKYGYDVQGNVLRLSLLRAPIDPDPHADEGHHAFTYAIYPHAGDWREGTVREAWELNAPLFPQVAPARAGDRPGAASLVTIDREDVIVDTVKRAEDSEALIVRLYEACGHRGQATLTFDRQPASVDECDLMEENDRPVTCTGSTLRIRVRPYELRTFKVTF